MEYITVKTFNNGWMITVLEAQGSFVYVCKKEFEIPEVIKRHLEVVGNKHLTETL